MGGRVGHENIPMLKESEYAINEGGYVILNEAASPTAMKSRAARKSSSNLN